MKPTITQLPEPTKTIVLDESTGEYKERTIYKLVEKDNNFLKVFIDCFDDMYDATTGSFQTLFYLVRNADRKNYFKGSIKEISDATGIKLRSTKTAMLYLAKKNYIRKVKKTLYQLNPNKIFKGSHDIRVKALDEYIGKK